MWDVTKDTAYKQGLKDADFYSHIPCGMWHYIWGIYWGSSDFYSHIPCGMWLMAENPFHQYQTISTHTSRVGCDLFFSIFCTSFQNFYSHIPCGMWLIKLALKKEIRQFLLTHPVWDVTYNSAGTDCRYAISTHTSRVGCDRWMRHKLPGQHHFYSHIPCGMWRRGKRF